MDDVDILTQQRDQGKLTWKAWSERQNAELRRRTGAQSPAMEAYLRKRVAWSSDVDRKKLTPEQAERLFIKGSVQVHVPIMKRIQRQKAAEAAAGGNPKTMMCMKVDFIFLCN